MRIILHRFVLTVFTFALALFSLTSPAHEIRPAVVDLKFNENTEYRIEVRMNVEALIAKIGPEHNDTSESVNANKYDALRFLTPRELTNEFKAFSNQFLEGIRFYSDKNRIHPNLIDVRIPDVGDTELARDSVIVLGGKLPDGAKQISWGWSDSFGANALRVSSNKTADLYTKYLQPGHTSEQILLEGHIKQSAWQVFTNYIVIGFEHIIPKGLDHILFVIGLFLLSMNMRALIWQITSFTVAHSITLALAILGLVQIPASIVEPLIALSIVYVCVENIFSDKLHAWRPVVVFTFGLLHGLGFASVLSEIGFSSSYFITGLLAFNIGIELGQLSVILACFLVVGYWFGHKNWYRSRITIPASAIIAMVGSYWFIERAMF